MTDPSALNTAAHQWLAAGFSVIPIKADGSKAPALTEWKDYQKTLPTHPQLDVWFAHDAHHGLGVVCGAVSGGLVMIEWESRAIAEGLDQAMDDAMDAAGETDLWELLVHGYVEETPSGGIHIYFRVAGPVRGNTKLARRPATAAELAANPADKVKVLIETRGEGGQSVAAPTPGTFHASGQPWTVMTGSVATIPTITVEQQDILFAVANSLDQMPTIVQKPVRTAPRPDGAEPGTRPGDDYNTKASWEDILTGWTPTRVFGPGAYGWVRPGKTDPGISATTGTSKDGVDRLYVFSTSTEFDTETPYSKFAAYAHLHCKGDYAAAARKLGTQGYGTKTKLPPRLPKEKRALTLVPDPPTVPDAPTVPGGSLFDEAPLDAPPAAGARQAAAAAAGALPSGFTDLGNAELFILQHHTELRYVPTRGGWLLWLNGTHWHPCEDDGEAITAVVETIDSIVAIDDTVRKFKEKSQSCVAIEHVAKLARRDPRIRVAADQLDAHPTVLNTPLGIVDLRTGNLVPCDPDMLHTKITRHGYQADALCPRFDQFMLETFGGDLEMIGYMQRLVGYSASGVTLFNILPFLYGGGRNGKSAFLEMIGTVLGDYSTSTPRDFLMKGGREDESATARLAGLRLVIASEVNRDDKFNEAKVKDLTGGEVLTARFLYSRHFTFIPSHTLWMMGNHQPRVEAGGESFWRRLRLIPFNYTVPDDKQVPGLAASIAGEEGPGILAWIVRGAIDVLGCASLRTPQSVLDATMEYAGEEDALARFMEDNCRIGGGDQVKTNQTVVRAAYESWCHGEGETPLTAQMFGRELKSRYRMTTAKSNGKRFYVGLSMIERRSEGSLPYDDDPRATPWDQR